MADLAFVEDSFFETPADVADELAQLVRPHLPSSGRLKIVDVCAGAGALARAIRPLRNTHSIQLSLLETNPRLLAKAQAVLGNLLAAPFSPTDVFSEAGTIEIGSADLALMNPPFGGIRGEAWGPRLDAALQEAASHPDIGCHYVLHVASILKPGAVLALVYRRNAFVSRAYRAFQEELSVLGALLELTDVQRRLRPGSGAAEAVLAIFCRGAHSEACWLKRRRLAEIEREGRLLSQGWRRLGSVASVRAGPSIRSELKSRLDEASQIVSVIEIPQGHDGGSLWGPDFAFDMHWRPQAFSVSRNLNLQGRSGFAYKLAASEFRTTILPEGYHFTSATPAVLPRRPYDLNFVVGCSLLPRWRQMVRDWVDSSNFTPGAVEEVLVPFSSFRLYRDISRAGSRARGFLIPRLRRARHSVLSVPDQLAEEVEAANRLLAQELEYCGATGAEDS